jgi:hypothetical protein
MNSSAAALASKLIAEEKCVPVENDLAVHDWFRVRGQHDVTLFAGEDIFVEFQGGLRQRARITYSSATNFL